MKFARYLQDTQTPEWKKAYIDYRGLKKQIGLIRVQQVETANSSGATDVNHTYKQGTTHENGYQGNSTAGGVGQSIDAHIPSKQGNTTSLKVPRPLEPIIDSPAVEKEEQGAGRPPIIRRRNSRLRPSLSVKLNALPPHLTTSSSAAPSQQTPLAPRTPNSPPVFPFFRELGPTTSLHALLPQLPATHVRFFELLDAELDKIESFYAEREKEMRERGKRLREQLNELGIHRRKFYESTAHSTPGWMKKAHLPLPSAFRALTDIYSRNNDGNDTDTPPVMASESGLGGQRDHGNVMELTPTTESRRRSSVGHGLGKKSKALDVDGSDDATRQTRATAIKDGPVSPKMAPATASKVASAALRDGLDPLEYQHAKKRLKKAVVEFYRGLEVLNNYRILNLTGFRKALKKYEKITKIPAQAAYMKEKVEPAAFASGTVVSTMLREMEDLFAARFERGDKKKAINRLRVGPLLKSHHFSTFRSGMWLGLAIPAVVAGSCLSFQEHTRSVLPSWNIILFIYSIFLIPVLFALLIGLNILVWARERINYVFIFELDVRTRLDHREYFELPSSLLCALAYAYWFSFARIGPPLLWPLIWVLLVLVVMFNPIRNIMWGRSRWWIIKSVAKLGVSGLWTVEFTDFWLGDQFCSLVYSLSNLYFVGCFYTRFFTNLSSIAASPAPSVVLTSSLSGSSYHSATGPLANLTEATAFSYDPNVQDAWTTCGTAENWGFYYLLGVLPFLVRLVQSVRRYWDSRLPTHLINAGKYGVGMLYYFFYFYWRHQDDVEHGASYILWCFTASVYAIYACAWDFLMDWSICKPHARHPFLRPELVYTSQIPSYYFALVTNVCIRFIWVFYIPTTGPSFTLRTFVAAVLEMLRRVQWNFYRLENEHLGNMDQYRVTREVPLPYSFDMLHSNEDEDEEDRDVDADGRASWLSRKLTRDSKRGREVSEK